MKRLKRIISLLLISVVFVLFCACSTGEYNLYYVQDAYNKKLISQDDWLYIAFYYAKQYDGHVYNDNLEVIEIEQDCELKQLSSSEINRIKNVYYNFNLSFFNSLLADGKFSSKQEILDNHIVIYNCGEYGGKYAVAIYSDLISIGVMEPWYIKMDNIRVTVYPDNQIYIVG